MRSGNPEMEWKYRLAERAASERRRSPSECPAPQLPTRDQGHSIRSFRLQNRSRCANGAAPATGAETMPFVLPQLSSAVDLLLNLPAIDRVAVAGESALPRGNRVGPTILLQPQIAEMVLDHGIRGQLFGGGRQRRVGQIELPLLHVGPAETVEIRRIVRLDLERSLDERDGFVERR